LTKKYS
jgi:hypothetical protein